MTKPLDILNLGAGVQSTTVLLMSCRGVLPKLDLAIFADTGWEPKAVYRHLEWLIEEAAKHGIPVVTVSAGNLRDDMLGWKEARAAKSRRARMPLFLLGRDGSEGMINRQCTSNYKVRPIERYIKTEVLGLAVRARWPKEVVVRQWFGISADEFRRAAPAVHRKKTRVEMGRDLFGRPLIRESEEMRPINWKTNVYPLCDCEFIGFHQHRLGYPPMGREDCLRWIEAAGFPRPPRSACIGCPFHSDAEWKRIREDAEEWQDAVDFDYAIRDYDHSNAGGMEFNGLRGECFLHAKRIPLDQVNFTDNDYPMFQCGNGVCGV